MPVVAMPDGTQVQFPDDMQPDQIKSMITQKFPDAAKMSTQVDVEQNAAANRKYVADTVSNIPGSAANMASDIYHAVAHPIDTAENIGSIGKGVLQKFGIVSGNDSEKYADAVGKFFADRYGGWENVKKTIKEDPVGALADLSTVLSAGGSLAARAPGMAGKAGKLAADAGNAVNPLNIAQNALKPIAKAGSEVIGGLTGTGGKSLQLAAEAGAAGGSKGQAFLDNINGASNMADVVTEAKGALQQLKAERGAAYRSGMIDVANDKTVLNFNDIDAAIQRTQGVKTYKGQDLSPATQGIRSQIADAVNKWKQLPPADFHTAEGLDALKQMIGDIRDSTEYGSPERLVASQAYGAIKNTIVDQAPKYAEVMKGYEEASGIVKDIEKTLSLKPNASVDTSIRKLQSVLRNNVNSNYGNRAALADYLVSAGADNLLTKLAGQSLNSWTPRGLGQLLAGGEVLSLPALAATNPKAAASVLATIPATSPKLMGLGAYGVGAASRVAPEAGLIGSQIGRTGGLGQ